jgi:hypothetical protein
VERLREIYDDYFRDAVEWLSRHRGRRRFRPLIIVGVAAAALSVVLASVLWITERGSGRPPIAYTPAAAPKDGHTVVNAEDAQVRSIAMVTKDRWAAGWSDCAKEPGCRYSAVIDRDGDKAVAPEWPVPYVTLRTGSEAIAVAPPPEGTLTGDATLLFRLTFDGPVTSKLRPVGPTTTFENGEILTDRIVPGAIAVVNLDDSTVRMLQTPGTRSPVCDLTGRCWLLTGVGRTDIVWTDDGGESWDSATLDEKNQRGRLTVSPDGRTLVTTAVDIGDSFETVATMRISTDRGLHWTTVEHPPWRLNAAPVAFNDGTAVVLGSRDSARTPQLYRIAEGSAHPDRGSPGMLTNLTTNAELLYSPQTSGRHATQVATSSDHGATWNYFVPR